MKPTISIIDYQAGNLRSVQKALEKCGANAVISADPETIINSDAVVFPGQGACDTSMNNLKNTGLDNVVKTIIELGTPFLGVCLGLQLLLDHSDEGNEPCLGVIGGKVVSLPSSGKIPHMGWNEVKVLSNHPVFAGMPENGHYYFVHSYVAVPEDHKLIAATTSYGIEFCSAVAFKNVVAVQFHPEKSGELGLQLYKNFVNFVDELRRI